MSKTAKTPFNDASHPDFIDMCAPESVLREVKTVLSPILGYGDFALVEDTFRDVVDLYEGRYPGYKSCNTKFHDLKHTTDVFLAMARIMHGKFLGGSDYDKRLMALGLSSALLHDAGYIQTVDDNHGTGAKYTSTHVDRSIVFAHSYLKGLGYSQEDASDAGHMIKATDLSATLGGIPYRNPLVREMGMSLFAADLLGQMADRTYLEKLLYLFQEFSEARLSGYECEEDLLAKTKGFYENFIKLRLENDAEYDTGNMKKHFQARWGIERDFYIEAVESNIAYLQHVLKDHREDYRRMLKRLCESGEDLI